MNTLLYYLQHIDHIKHENELTDFYQRTERYMTDRDLFLIFLLLIAALSIK